MDSFELRSTCNLLTKELNGLVDKTNILRLSIDIELPDVFQGEPGSLLKAIKEVTRHVSTTLINGVIDIELLLQGLSGQAVALRVAICGQGFWKSKAYGQNKLSHPFSYPGLVIHEKIKEDELRYEWIEYLTPLKGVDLLREFPFSGKKTLIVEDNEINALVFSSFLEEWGCETTVVQNGAKAISQMYEVRYDIILMDIHMPILNGNLATKKIREFSEVPIIALTGSLEEKDMQDAIEAGANDFLVKPVSSTQLFHILEKYL